ncbi:MAG: hypothetical protein AVDCRST_MAG05-3653 [uncultured Rubrobacteraceae bacterium]|uniref:Uncharacterized protein n=1 Tax=uncultured Rubrobacteraceae bacterium TaxID=349277 RepID=A0A6J4TF77_9ACTN|nr:MAG: hypothetical protein AVDCRST_MAG05-3653 [uncultured Rubrobacteraceae bacterium]
MPIAAHGRWIGAVLFAPVTAPAAPGGPGLPVPRRVSRGDAWGNTTSERR